MKTKSIRAIYSGTFDPVTNGHIDIIKRGLKVFDEVVVAVSVNKSKTPMFGIDKRVELLQKATKNLAGVKIQSFDKLLVDFARKENINTIIRGLRAVSDFEYELQMGYANYSLDENIDTIYFMPTLKNAFVSSSIVREIIKYDGDYSHLVPHNIIKELKCI